MTINIYNIEEDYTRMDAKEPLFVENLDLFQIKKYLNDPKVIKPMDKRIFLLYLELGSLRKAEAACGISHKRINEIFHKVRLQLLEKLKYD